MRVIDHDRGAVSIFLVVFFALLATVVTVSFVRLMLQDQLRATDQDLSRSAYDSAMVGVEDAKRALTRYDQLSDADKAARQAQLNTCNGMLPLLGGTAGEERTVQVSSSSNDDQLNQAYTCVKINLQTESYEGPLDQDQPRLLSLASVAPFQKIRVEWFTREDAGGATVSVPNVDLTQLPITQSWVASRPPILETQLIQTASTGFRLNQFDSTATGGSNTNTLFLFPHPNVPATELSFSTGDVRGTPGSPSAVRCATSVASVVYACSTVISLPDPVGGSAATRQASLRLVARKNATHFRVSLLDSANNTVLLNGVQPRIDATGRANDVYRRVSATVEVGALVEYPDAAVDITGNLCKTLMVTTRPEDYQTGSCTP